MRKLFRLTVVVMFLASLGCSKQDDGITGIDDNDTLYDDNFIEYNSDSAAANSLYAQLLLVSDNRNKMVELAVDFIDGIAPFEGQFIPDPASHQDTVCRFYLLYMELYHATPDNLENLKKAILNRLGIDNWNDLVLYIKSRRYASEKDRIWQNLFALYIVMGYDIELLDSMERILIICHLIERIVYSPEGEDLFSSAWEIMDALYATVLLPEEIFPLPPL